MAQKRKEGLAKLYPPCPVLAEDLGSGGLLAPRLQAMKIELFEVRREDNPRKLVRPALFWKFGRRALDRRISNRELDLAAPAMAESP